ncbi:GAF domain-containing protein, partial [bacterium]
MLQAEMYRALSATNEAILKTIDPNDLFQRVCDAAVSGGFKSARVLLPAEEGWLRVAASSGTRGSEPLSDLRTSIDPTTVHGQGLAGTAFRSGQASVSNDFQSDPRFRPWRAVGRGQGIGAAAAIPILQDNKSVGVVLLFVREPHSLTEEIVRLVERMVENVSFALSNFARETQRKAAERALRRSSDMFAALSSTNSAILQAMTKEEMFQLVCSSVAKGGRSLGAAAIFLKDPRSHWLKLTAASGNSAKTIGNMPLSIDAEHAFGGGLHGPAFRDQIIQISYDTSVDPRTQPWYDSKAVAHGCAAVPLVINGASNGILFFFFARTSGREDAEITQLMSDIGKNVSFGLQMFEREAQKERIARMFAALSETNEAIMRASDRDELFQ